MVKESINYSNGRENKEHGKLLQTFQGDIIFKEQISLLQWEHSQISEPVDLALQSLGPV